MIAFGPVAEAAKGGHSSPSFDLCVGFAVLALTWLGYSRQGPDHKISIWAVLVSAQFVPFSFAPASMLFCDNLSSRKSGIRFGLYEFIRTTRSFQSDPRRRL